MDKEWGVFLEKHVSSLDLPVGLQEQAARECMNSCTDSNELTHYQAFQVLTGFIDSRGYS